jgi:hypothetical protein
VSDPERIVQNPTPPPPPDVVVVVVGGTVVVVVGGGGGEVVGGDVGGGLVDGGLVGGLVGGGLFGACPPEFAGADVGRVVVEDDGFDPGVDVGGTVTIVPELVVRSSVPLELTVNQLFANA